MNGGYLGCRPESPRAEPEVDTFELEEAERLIDSATGQDREIVTVLIFCGIRPNEALTLRWQDVDFGRRILKIRRTIYPFGGIGPPKTASSERDVDMLAPVITELEEQRARTQMRGELVFLDHVGGPIDLTNFRDRNWKRILVKARLRARTIYQCRHTFAATACRRAWDFRPGSCADPVRELPRSSISAICRPPARSKSDVGSPSPIGSGRRR